MGKEWGRRAVASPEPWEPSVRFERSLEPCGEGHSAPELRPDGEADLGMGLLGVLCRTCWQLYSFLREVDGSGVPI